MNKSRVIRVLFVLAPVMIFAGVFQNCAKQNFASDQLSTVDVLKSYSDKLFVRYTSGQPCEDGSNILDAIQSHEREFYLVRASCRNLSSEVELLLQRLRFTTNGVLVYRDQEFEATSVALPKSSVESETDRSD